MKLICFIFILITLSACNAGDGAKLLKNGKNTPAEIIITGNTIDKKEVNTTTNVTITFKNSGSFSATSLTISSPSSPFSYMSGTCGTTLAGGESCTQTFQFSPTVENSYSQVFSLNYNNGILSTSQTFALNAQALTKGNLVIRTLQTGDLFTSYNFGVIPLDTSRDQILNIQNTGGFDVTMVSVGTLVSPLSYKGGIFPGTGGTCSFVVAGHSSCSIVLTYAPTGSEGSIAQDLDLNYLNGVGVGNLNYIINGTAIDLRGLITFTDGANYDFANFPLNPSSYGKNYAIVIENSRYIDSVSIVPTLTDTTNFSFKGGTYPGTGGDCSTTLLKQSTCTIMLSFHPTTLTAHTATLTLNYNDNHAIDPHTASANIVLTGTGVTAGLLELDPLSPSTVFPLQEVGTELNRIYTLKNNGAYTISNLRTGTITSPYFWTGGTCLNIGATVIAGGTCTIGTSFLPTSEGTFTSPFNFLYDSGQSASQTVAAVPDFSGTSTQLGQLTIAHSFGSGTINFPSLMNNTSGSVYTVTLTNSGLGSATGITFPAPATLLPFIFSNNTCGATLTASSTCTFTLQFSPTIIGTSNLAFTIFYNNQLVASSLSFSLNGTSLSPASLSLLPASLDFGSINVSDTLSSTVTITNAGSADATNVTPTISSPFTIITGGTCGTTGFTVAGNSNCTILVAFTPPGLGVFNETLFFNYHDGSSAATTSNITLTGTGANVGKMVLTTATSTIFNYGQQSINTITDQIFTFENQGNGNATGLSLAALSGAGSAAYSVQANTCAGTKTPSQTCSITLRFAPLTRNVSGTNNLWLAATTLSYNDGVIGKNIAFALTGTALTPPTLAIKDNIAGSTSYNYGNNPVNITLSHDYKVTNSGEVSTQGLSLAVTNISDMPYTITNDACTGYSVAPSSYCTFKVNFLPTVQQTFTSTITASYTNNYGSQNLPLTYAITGVGVRPVASFVTWSDIYAASSSTSTSVSFSWAALTTDVPVTYTKYYVYRSTSPLPTDLTALTAYKLSGSISPSVRTYTDSNLSPETIYYYTIRPVYGPTDTVIDTAITDTSAYLKIIAPPLKMALVHRWMANIEICGLMGIASDKANNFRCTYTGIGTNGGFYDLGYHLLVDRYEMSLDATSKGQNASNVTPKTAMTQTDAASYCDDMDEYIESTRYIKRLLRRAEQVVASAWPTTLSNSDRENIETGAVSGACANTQTTIQTTGTRSLCVSRYGVYDIVGNAWEWASDRTSSGMGVVTTLDAGNTSIVGFSLSGSGAGSYTSQACLNFPLGLAKPISGGSCVDSSTPVTTIGTDKLTGDYFWPPVGSGGRGVRSGGGVGSSGDSFAAKSGRWTVDWYIPVQSANNYTGARCGFSVP